MTQTIEVEKSEGIVTFTLCAPASHNALTPRMLCELADAVADFAGDDSLRAAIITGQGSQAFCAGGDLARTLPLMSGDRAPQDEWDRRLLGDPAVMAASGLRDFPLDKPVIAAINGFCMAGGFEIMLGTDIRVSAEHAVFALPEVKRALIPFSGSLARLPRQIGYCNAMELLLTGEPVSAAEALRLGLINRVVPADRLMETACAYARRIAANGPFAVRAVKRAVTACSGLPLEEAFVVENREKALVMASADAREGPRAFMEKRAPDYQGR